jgi:hypothetical protein
MPGLVPGIHVLLQRDKKDVDGRDKPGHDERAALSVRPRRVRENAPVTCMAWYP